MIFKNTKRFSPVIWEGDVPHSYDLFHFKPTQIPKTKKEKEKFYKENNIIIDKDYWQKQWMRCIYGYTVYDAIEPGGDAYPDNVLAFWDGDDCHVPIYKTTFKKRSVHITGRMYFYLNFWPIYGALPGEKIKRYIKPRFLDIDYFFFQRIQMMMDPPGKDGQELKGRQIGMSHKLSGGILAYNYTFVDSSVNIVVGGQQVDADNTFKNCEVGLTSLVNTQFYKERAAGGDNNELLEAIVDSAQIRSITAKDNPQAVSRFSPFFVVHEEVGKGKKGWSIATASYIDPSVHAEKIKTGFQLYLGTGGSMDEGVADLEERHYHPEEYNILSFPGIFDEEINYDVKVGHFIPKCMFWITDVDGNSKKEESIKDIQKNIIDKAIGKDKYIKMTQYPIFDSNVFMIESGGFFGKEISMLLQRRKNYIRTHQEENIILKGRLDWINKNRPFDGVRFTPDEKGWLSVIEDPETDAKGNHYYNLYEAGTDSYNQDESHTSDSKGACFVRKLFKPGSKFYNCYVAMINERPSVGEGGADIFFEHTALMVAWYGCQNNIEMADNRIFDWYKNNRCEGLLKARPRLAFATKFKESRLTNPYGTDKSLKPHILAILRDRLDEDFISQMYFIEQIDAFIKFRYDPSGKKYNCDITMASAEAEVAAKESEFSVVISEEEANSANKTRGLITYQNVRGVLTPKFI